MCKAFRANTLESSEIEVGGTTLHVYRLFNQKLQCGII